ncbi:MAG: hypothetical protein K0U60_09765 [Actinomycetia bacterium]|nr:hypothetical protein [Actinomycetes bacterium]MCH9801667.1 hypothetical protein [Actinomycetes bacterium]
MRTSNYRQPEASGLQQDVTPARIASPPANTPALATTGSLGRRSIVYAHYCAPGMRHWFITEYDQVTGEMRGWVQSGTAGRWEYLSLSLLSAEHPELRFDDQWAPQPLDQGLLLYSLTHCK